MSDVKHFNEAFRVRTARLPPIEQRESRRIRDYPNSTQLDVKHRRDMKSFHVDVDF